MILLMSYLIVKNHKGRKYNYDGQGAGEVKCSVGSVNVRTSMPGKNFIKIYLS